MPSSKRAHVRNELSNSLSHVLPLILQVLQQPNQGEMTVQAIKCLQAWVVFGIPMENTAPIVEKLLHSGKNSVMSSFCSAVNFRSFLFSTRRRTFRLLFRRPEQHYQPP